MTRTCPQCQATLIARDPRTIYCSSKCAAQATWPKRVKYGAECNFYNGGLSFLASGRCTITCRNNRQVYFAQAVMAAHLGRWVRPGEIVHHKNEDPTDDRIENLEILTRSEHGSLHNPRTPRPCSECGETFTPPSGKGQRKTCSTDCIREAKRRAGRAKGKNPNAR